MDCKFCGASVSDSDVLCPYCGSSLEELIPLDEEVTESAVQDETAALAQDDFAQDDFAQEDSAQEDVQAPFADINTEGTMPAPKKSKIGKIVLFSIIGLLAVGIILLALNFSSAYSWFKIKTSSGKSLLKTGFHNSLDEFVDSYEDYVEDAVKMSSAPQWGTQMQASLEMNEQIFSALDDAFAQQGMDLNLSWLQDLNLDMQMLFDKKASTAMIAYGIGVAGEELFSIEAIVDQTNEQLWVAYPSLSETAIYASSSDDKYMQSAMENLIDRMNQNGNDYPPEKLESLLKKYGDVIIDGFGKVKKSSKTVEIDGISQKFTVLDAYMSEENAINMCITLLETVKNDQDLKQLILQMSQQMILSMSSFYEDAPYGEEEFYNEFLDAIDEQLENLRNELNELDVTKEICLTFYMDNDFQIAGFKVKDENGDELFRFVGVEEKERYAAEFVAGDVVITDSGKVQEKNTGTMSLSVDGAELFTVDHTTSEKDDVMKATLKLKLGDDLMQQISSQIGQDAAMLYMTGVALQLDATMSEEQADFQLSFVMVGQKLISVNLKIDAVRNVEIIVPTDGFNSADEEQLENWVASWDLEGLMDKLTELGLPVELIDELMG